MGTCERKESGGWKGGKGARKGKRDPARVDLGRGNTRWTATNSTVQPQTLELTQQLSVPTAHWPGIMPTNLGKLVIMTGVNLSVSRNT